MQRVTLPFASHLSGFSSVTKRFRDKLAVDDLDAGAVQRGLRDIGAVLLAASAFRHKIPQVSV